MSVFAICVGGFYVGSQSTTPTNYALVQPADDARLFASQPEAEAYSHTLVRHPTILPEVWAQRFVTEGWYVLAKGGRYLASQETVVHWVAWEHSRLFNTPAEIEELIERMIRSGVDREEFVDTGIHLHFASAPA